MKVVTKYIANDDTEFLELTKCESYERLCVDMVELMSKLKGHPDNCSFSNGSGYLQHSKDAVSFTKRVILEQAKLFTDHKWIQQSIDDLDGIDSSWAGRVIYETCPKPLRRAWGRIECIDSSAREWGQPFFKNNPEKATMKKLN